MTKNAILFMIWETQLIRTEDCVQSKREELSLRPLIYTAGAVDDFCAQIDEEFEKVAEDAVEW